VQHSGTNRISQLDNALGSNAAAGAVAESNAAKYGGTLKRVALLDRVRESGSLSEAKGVVNAFREMRRLGYSLEDVSLQYRGNQGLDLVFSKAGAYAVAEAKAGASMSLLKTYKGGVRQGSLDYNISRLERYLEHGDGKNNVLVNKLLDEASVGRLESFATFYRSRKTYELPLGWPSVPQVAR
jgi:hypothetical protein